MLRHVHTTIFIIFVVSVRARARTRLDIFMHLCNVTLDISHPSSRALVNSINCTSIFTLTWSYLGVVAFILSILFEAYFLRAFITTMHLPSRLFGCIRNLLNIPLWYLVLSVMATEQTINIGVDQNGDEIHMHLIAVPMSEAIVMADNEQKETKTIK